MKSRVLFTAVLCALGLSSSTLAFAAESVRSGSELKKVGDVFTGHEKFYDVLRKDENFKKHIDGLMKKFRPLHDCYGPNFEKDAPTKKSAGPGMKCTDLFSYESAIAKSEDLAKTCKQECLKDATKSATGKSASALTTCLTDSCEKQCDFKNTSFKTELDSFLRGALDQGRDNAAAM